MRVFSYGGGVQSTACLVLAAQGIIDYQQFYFCNVGDDSEHPDTLRYVREVAIPYAAAHGIALQEIQKVNKHGQPVTLYQQLTRPGSRSIGIPVRMNGSGAPGRRSCTYDFKIAIVDRHTKCSIPNDLLQRAKADLLRHCGVSSLDKDTVPLMASGLRSFFQHTLPLVEVGLGISLDEIQRVKPNMDPETIYWKVNTHPLIFEVPKPLTRQDCMNIIARAGLPIPPKSACWFCPFHSLAKWQAMRHAEPALFWRAVELETLLNTRRKGLGMDEVWFTRLLIPLDEATTAYQQQTLFQEEDSECEGYCFV